jgi:Amt family ammonium transporter
VASRPSSAYDVVVSLIILKLIDWTIGLRVAKKTKVEGLDITLHGEVMQ